MMATLKESAMCMFMIYVVLLGIDGSALVVSYQHSITVSLSGTDNQTCLTGGNPCQTLNYTFQHGSLKNSTKVTILPGAYNLSTALAFAPLEDFALFALESGEVSIQCASGGGFSFEKSNNLRFRGIVFKGCGSLHESRTTGSLWANFTLKFYAGLFLASCTNLNVENCTFRDSPGVGVNLYDVGGSVDISQSWFMRNGADAWERNCGTEFIVASGAGIYIEFTGQAYESGVNLPVKNSNYSITDCHFVKNYAPQSQLELHPVKNTFVPFGRGGGISVFLRGSTEGNTVLIDRCTFHENNASWGGGVFYELQDQAQNNYLKIRDSKFWRNWASYGGGGTRTGSFTTENTQFLRENQIIHDNCTFTENRAIFGGGVSHYGSTYLPGDHKDGSRHKVFFIDCMWDANRATAGSAIGLNVLSESQIRVHPLVPFYVTLKRCHIKNNRIILTEDLVVNGYGALYTNAAHLIFKDSVTFENNTNMTALLLDNAFVYIHNKTVFRDNTGELGGAIGLYGESRIITWSCSELLFENNYAQGMGGAIYIRAPGPPMAAFQTRYLAIHECFLSFENLTHNDVEQWHTNITFKNNYASEGAGNAVYATTLQSCYKYSETREHNNALHWPNVVTFIGSSMTSEISTDPVSINIDKNDWHNLSPSQKFNASVFLTNERNQSSYGTVEIKITQPKQDQNCSDIKLVPSSLFIVQKNGQIVGLQFTGKPNCNFTIQFKSPPGRQFIQPAPFVVSLVKCHAGFVWSDHNKSCTCMNKLKYRGISRCGEDGRSVYLKKGYWFGQVGNTGPYDTYPCPEHYCNKSFMISSGQSTNCFDANNFTDEFLYNKATMCAENRSGTLCGSCLNGNYSVLLGDEKCISTCSNLSLLWLVVFVVGVLCVVLIILAIPHLEIFTSYLNALLFSFQVMDILILEHHMLDPGIAAVINFAHWRISTSGFEVFRGMDNLSKLGINYIFPFYIVVLLIVLMFVSKHRQNIYFRENVFPAFSALIVLCYTNVTDISFNIIDYVHIGDSWVLFLHGDIDSDEKWLQIFLTIVASLWIIVFVVPVPLILLFRPSFIDQIRFLENICNSFSQCYRQGYKWFAAFYFICRIILIVLSKFLPLGPFLPLKRSILEASTILMVVFLLYIKPYHEEFSVLNKVDLFLLVNLSFITVFSTSMSVSSSNNVYCAAWVILEILCWIPVAVLLYLIWTYRLAFLERGRELKEWITGRLPRCCQTCDEEGDRIIEEPTSTSATEDGDV